MKFLLLVFPAFLITSYISEKTYHELEIPKTEAGNSIKIDISDESLEDAVGEILQIPLRFFPRELCFKNRNRIFVNGQEPSEYESDADTYIDYPGGHSIKLPTTKRLEENCVPVKVAELIGATTTMGSITAVSVRIDLTQTPLPTSFKIEPNTENSRLYVHITQTGTFLLFVSNILVVGGSLLLLTSILKFIYEEQFPNFKIDSNKICSWICRT